MVKRLVNLKDHLSEIIEAGIFAGMPCILCGQPADAHAVFFPSDEIRRGWVTVYAICSDHMRLSNVEEQVEAALHHQLNKGWDQLEGAG